MQKIISISAVVLIFLPVTIQAAPVQRNSEQMLVTVKRLYASYLPGSIRPYSDIRQAVTPRLRNILDRERRVSIAIQGMACIDYELTGLVDDSEETDGLIRRTIRITPQSTQSVRVSFQQERGKAPTVVYYKLICSNNHCLIDDIAYSNQNNSLKREVLACLRRYAR